MIPYNFELNIDFKKDWKDFLIKILEERGYKIDNSLNSSQISNLFFNLNRRFVSARKRRIFVSKEFKCPPEYEAALEAIIMKIKSGNDITSHLSTRIKKINYKDLLLNDWGIHHLHLDTTLIPEGKNKEFVKRTRDVLFVKFELDKAFLIQILDHNSFPDIDLLRIMHNNWPDIMSKYKTPFQSLIPGPSNTKEEIQALRDAGVTTMYEIEPGVVYFPPGMGLTTAKTSVAATRESQRFLNNISLFEKHVREKINIFLKVIRESTGESEIKKLHFFLIVEDFSKFSTIEIYSGTEFYLATI
ncbi:hypothetical protein [Paenibacillus sp. An7]|uniref:hypothetical protein n=1 Tax=Paenibacillus sp. An7 TaxID=2689577 RepID=UPI001356BD98|nr:hypothetical protein [Paenibacillus sp. An7]